MRQRTAPFSPSSLPIAFTTLNSLSPNFCFTSLADLPSSVPMKVRVSVTSPVAGTARSKRLIKAGRSGRIRLLGQVARSTRRAGSAAGVAISSPGPVLGTARQNLVSPG